MFFIYEAFSSRARGGAEKKLYEAKIDFFKEVDPKVNIYILSS